MKQRKGSRKLGPARRVMIARILETQRVPSQKKLRAELLLLGHEVAQSTVSKDLAALGAAICGDDRGTMWRIKTQQSCAQ